MPFVLAYAKRRFSHVKAHIRSLTAVRSFLLSHYMYLYIYDISLTSVD